MASYHKSTLNEDINDLLNEEDDTFWKEAWLLPNFPIFVTLLKLSSSPWKSSGPSNGGLSSINKPLDTSVATLPGLVELRTRNFSSKMDCVDKLWNFGCAPGGSRGGNKHMSVFRKHRKQWTSNKITRKMVLGSDVGLEDTCQLVLCALVGRFAYGHLCSEKTLAWSERIWLPVLGYSPKLV
jgi:hypothetical protein